MRGLARPVLAGLVLACAIGAAGDPASPSATPPRTQEPAAPAATPTPPPAGDIEDFVPSEKVSADDAVAFPVDI